MVCAMAAPVQPDHVSEQLSPLRDARLRKGLSLQHTAALVGVDCGHLSRVERRQSQASVDVLYRLAVVLDIRRLRNALAPYVGGERAS